MNKRTRNATSSGTITVTSPSARAEMAVALRDASLLVGNWEAEHVSGGIVVAGPSKEGRVRITSDLVLRTPVSKSAAPKRGRPNGSAPGSRADLMSRMRVGDVLYFEQHNSGQTAAYFQQQIACDAKRAAAHCGDDRKFTTHMHTAVPALLCDLVRYVIRVERVL